ncbi:MAG: NAD(P)/FAD-dependent oxidoreductase [Epulopiscium sp.]|nr:NAD(P)/FAD-dependent oxidoreductase [Candidatus Epulonipiscium sp.]
MRKKSRIIVIGGGASGLVAAIMARRNGSEVVILERMDRVGKKILASGNGRCNLTNSDMNLNRFHTSCPKFVAEVLNHFDVHHTLQFFEKIGISYTIQDGGKIYPMSLQASSVLDVLRYEIERLGVEEICEAEVIEIKKNNQGFILFLKDGRKIFGDKVIIATGGKSAPNLGSNGSGYDLAISLGHRIIHPFPALVQLTLDAWFLKRLKGVKFEGRVSVIKNSDTIQMENGEILFTEYGISGPPILQLSRKVGELLMHGKVNPYLSIDSYPDLSEAELNTMIYARFSRCPEKPIEFSFVGMINKRLIPVILKEAKIEDTKRSCSKMSSTEIKSIINTLKDWKIPIKGTRSWMQSQVTAGGIDVADINPNTMESKLIKGLYFAGEIVDVDGDCGGFNLQWAWSSGHIAGENASK